jgi:cation transporter-like permease
MIFRTLQAAMVGPLFAVLVTWVTSYIVSYSRRAEK